MLEMGFDVPRDRVRQFCAMPRCVETVALLGARERQSADATHDRAQIEDLGRRRLPRLERHPAGEREKDVGIDAIGLRALHERAPEVSCGHRVHHHDLDVGRSMQR